MADDKGSGGGMTRERAMIAAVADNGAIGRGNSLPWHIREDMRFFRRTTTGNAIIMGWNTYLSIGGKPLPNRKNIVISTHGFPTPQEGVVYAKDIDEAFEKAGGGGKVFVIGGAKTYEAAMQKVDTLYITSVHAEISDADAFFPEIDPAVWEETERSEVHIDEESGLPYEFIAYKRKKQ